MRSEFSSYHLLLRLWEFPYRYSTPAAKCDPRQPVYSLSDGERCDCAKSQQRFATESDIYARKCCSDTTVGRRPGTAHRRAPGLLFGLLTTPRLPFIGTAGGAKRSLGHRTIHRSPMALDVRERALVAVCCIAR